jgi:hypothetical protein
LSDLSCLFDFSWRLWQSLITLEFGNSGLCHRIFCNRVQNLPARAGAKKPTSENPRAGDTLREFQFPE